MSPLNILVLENDSQFVSTLKINLSKWGRANIVVFKEVKSARSYLDKNSIDLIIAKPTLDEKHDGIEFGEAAAGGKKPLIYIADSEDNEAYDKTNKQNVLSFLIRPFDFKTFYAALNLYFDNTENFLIISRGKEKVRVPYNDILWIKSAGNYSIIRTDEKEYSMKISLKRLIDSFLGKNFIQIHRAFIIRVDKIDGINVKINVVYIKDNQLPIGRKYRKTFFDRIDII